MVIFGQKPCINPFVKMSIFRLFLTSCFYSLERRFFVLEYRKRHFPCLYCLKKQVCNNSHFWTKTMRLPVSKNVNLLTFLTSSFYSLERRFFVLEYHKRYFSCLYCLKKKVKKRAIFGQKPWVNPFGKISIFRLFQFHVVIA